MQDDTLFTWVIAGIVVWFLVGVAEFVRRWLRKTKPARQWKKTAKLLKQGKLPEDYSIITERARHLNNMELELSKTGPWDADKVVAGQARVRQRLGDLKRIRQLAGRIRERGFIVGNNAYHRNQSIERALKENPYSKKSDPGAYKQWIKGCCMGMSRAGMTYHPKDYV